MFPYMFEYLLIVRVAQDWIDRRDARRCRKGKPGVEAIWPEYFGDDSARS